MSNIFMEFIKWFLLKNLSLKTILVAEMSANHNGSLSTAKKIIKLAKYGADAINCKHILKFNYFKLQKIF